MLTIGARAKNVDEARICLELGFPFLEVTLPCPGGRAEELGFARLVGDHGAFLLGHGPQEGNPADLDGLEHRYLPKLRQALEQAAFLKAPALTVHFWFESRWLSAEVIEGKIALLARAAAWGASLGVRVLVENLSEAWPDLARALDAVPGLGLTLDVGHAQLLHPENQAPAIIENLFPRLGHLHLHDNCGGNSPKDDLHLIPGRGSVPFVRVFSALKSRGYAGTATLELAADEMFEGREAVRAFWEAA